MLIVVPHAREKMAGPARTAAFAKVKKFGSVAIVSADANVDHVMWELPMDVDIRTLVLTEEADIASTVAEVLVTKPALIVVVANLTHYGAIYGNDAPGEWPPQILKRSQEATLIDALVTKTELVGEASLALRFASAFTRQIERWGNGQVVDYYDSLAMRHSQQTGCELDRYLPCTPIEDRVGSTRFVSYVAIVFGSRVPDGVTCSGRLRKRLLFGTFKLALSCKGFPPQLPSWVRPSLGPCGVFVGTSMDGGRTNCSYGRFEDDATSLEDKIVAAAHDCWRDSRERWQLPITAENTNQLTLKLEVLAPRNTWRDAQLDLSDVKVGTEGILVEFTDGSSGTFLPVVLTTLPTAQVLPALRAKIHVGENVPVQRVLAFRTRVETEASCWPGSQPRTGGGKTDDEDEDRQKDGGSAQ